MMDDAEVCAHVFELAGDIFSQRFEHATASWAVLINGQMYALFSLKVIGQRFTTGALATWLRLRRVSSGGRTFVSLKVLKS